MKDLVLLSSALPISKNDQVWRKLSKLAKIEVAENNSLKNDPRLKNAKAVVSLLTDNIGEEFFSKAPSLQIVANFAVGFNNIDIKAAKKRRVAVCNTPDVLTNATAELAIGLMFAASRRFKEGSELLQKDKFKGWSPNLLLGQELSGSTLGIIGYGRIGKSVAKKAKALGMNVIAYSRSQKTVSFATLLKKSDFISIHCPLTAQTYKLIGPNEFQKMKKGAFLINTSRGEVLDENALVNAIDSQKIRGAALDVFWNEPKLSKKLKNHPQIIVLPHLGSATVQARSAMSRLVLQSIVDVLSGRSPRNLVG